MAVSAQLFELIDSTVAGMGYELVDAERAPRGLLRIVIDCEAGVTLDDCERVSNQLNHLFTVENIDFDRLEISSPGVDRPLRKLADFKRFIGQMAHIELYAPMMAEGLPENGRRRMDGKILAVLEEAGAEKIQIELVTERTGRTPSQIAREKIAKRKAGVKAEKSAPVLLNVAFKDIERASLVAELDFKGGIK